jgi:hypothetical protein
MKTPTDDPAILFESHCAIARDPSRTPEERNRARHDALEVSRGKFGYCFKAHACDRFGNPLDDEQNNQKENKVPTVDQTIRNILKFIAHRDGVPLRLMRTQFGEPEVDVVLSTLLELELITCPKRNVYEATSRGIQHLKANESSTEISHNLTPAEVQVLFHIEYAERVLDRPGEDWERLFCRIGTDVFDALRNLLKFCLIFEDRKILCPTYRTSPEGRTALRVALYGL